MEQKRDTLVWIGLAAASSLLAVDPLTWLINSWQDPSYQSHGGLYCLVLAGLVVLSLKSSPSQGPTQTGRVFVLFLFAASLRLLGQVLAINILSALALAADVYALAALLGLDRRRFAISPFWLAVFFLFALPLGPILQRVAGYPLQMVSADVACQMLSPAFADLICEGVRLRVNGADVLVDLPCSGASGLLLMVSLWAFLNVIYRPAMWAACVGLGIIVALALLGNSLRIAVLAGGLALGFDMMANLPHVAVGLASTVITAGLALVLYQPEPAKTRTQTVTWALPLWARIPTLACAIIAAISIISAPKRPLDVSTPVQAAILPMQLNGQRAVHVALSDTEEHYFTAFGGTAQKVQYGPLGLNLVRTSSPLRHLHSPETCLRGMGFTVQFKGTRFDPIPTSIYEATGPDGRVWTVAVSFVSEDGHTTAGVGEAVWSWLSGSSRNWQSIQRITPANLPETTRISYELATLAALDLT
jgi:exosortase/archaeosortase family protein